MVAMCNDDYDGIDLEELRRLVEAGNKYGQPIPHSREYELIEELDHAQEFGASALAAYGLKFTDFEHGADPPDVVARLADSEVGIEVTRLIDRDVLETNATRESLDEPPAQRFPWTLELFEEKVNGILDAKNGKYRKRGVKIDFLLVHSDEHWLLPHDVASWMETLRFDPRETMGSAYLTLSYDPGHGPHRPIFRLYR